MYINEDTNTRFHRLKCCVIIPACNNSAAHEQLFNDTALLTDNIIVVNNGSTGNTSAVLKKTGKAAVPDFKKNKGKVSALKTGFDKAAEAGFRYAITIDPCRHYSPGEILLFLNEIEKTPDALVVGVRDFRQKNINCIKKIVNKFYCLLFNFITGIRLSDPQSGLRLYPLTPVNKLKPITTGYGFEFEILVRAAWKSTGIVAVPVSGCNHAAGKGGSYFRSFLNFARAVLLCTALFFISVLYVKPRNALKSLKKKQIKDFFRNNIIASKDSNAKIVASVMFGIFMGVVPIWGYQLVVAIALAHVLKLNKILVIVAANISIAPMMPVIIYMSYRCGFIMGLHSHGAPKFSDITYKFIQDNLIQYIIGSILFGIILALAFGIVVFILLKLFRKQVKPAISNW